MIGLVVGRSGTISVVELGEPGEYYKTCGFRNPDGFEKRASWTVDGDTVELFAKSKGKAHTENSYEFPPPVDKKLYFGRCLLVNPTVSLTVEKWEEMYETLMGGFEDLDASPLGDEEDEEDEEEDIDPNLIGKNGYMKDGFVVEDDEDEFEEEEEDIVADTESEEEVKHKKKPKRKPATTNTSKNEKKKSDKDKKKKSSSIEPIMDISIVAVTDNYLDCSSELVEEAYV
jgi:hypothetical protein